MSEQQVSTYRRENEARFSASDDRRPNQQECFLCHRVIEQDDDTRGWFDPDEHAYYKPCFRNDFLDSFETQMGWCCSTDCWNDNCVNDEDLRTGLHLVKGGRS